MSQAGSFRNPKERTPPTPEEQGTAQRSRAARASAGPSIRTPAQSPSRSGSSRAPVLPSASATRPASQPQAAAGYAPAPIAPAATPSSVEPKVVKTLMPQELHLTRIRKATASDPKFSAKRELSVLRTVEKAARTVGSNPLPPLEILALGSRIIFKRITRAEAASLVNNLEKRTVFADRNIESRYCIIAPWNFGRDLVAVPRQPDFASKAENFNVAFYAPLVVDRDRDRDREKSDNQLLQYAGWDLDEYIGSGGRGHLRLHDSRARSNVPGFTWLG